MVTELKRQPKGRMGGWTPRYLSPTFIGQFTIFTMVQMNNKEMVSHPKLFNNEGQEMALMMNYGKTSSKKKWRSMRIDPRERRRGLTPFILLPRPLHLTAPPLLAPRWGAKLFRLRRKSSIRPSAPSSLVVQGGAERWDGRGRRRTG